MLKRVNIFVISTMCIVSRQGIIPLQMHYLAAIPDTISDIT
jgi:hypothetical protein